jgi:hypothetical protein
MAIDQALLTQYFPRLEWRMFEESACAKVPNESRFIDPSITILDYKDGTYAASLYLNDGLILSSWIEDESLEGVLKSLQEIMLDVKAALSYALPNTGTAATILHLRQRPTIKPILGAGQ